MAEDVVEDVGFLKIVELLRRADEIARGKAPVREMVEKDVVGDEPRHRDDLPSRRRHQSRVERAVIGNARLFEAQHVDTAQKSLRCAPGQHLRLAREEPIPHRMFVGGERVPILRNRPVRSEEHTSELQSLMRISYAVFCLKKKKSHNDYPTHTPN